MNYKNNKFFSVFHSASIALALASVINFPAVAADTADSLPIITDYGDGVTIKNAVIVHDNKIEAESITLEGATSNFNHDSIPMVWGSLTNLSENLSISANTLDIKGNFVNGDGTKPFDLVLNIDTVTVVNFTTKEKSNLTIEGSLLNATGNIEIADGLYMGDDSTAIGTKIKADNPLDTYTIKGKNFKVDGALNAENGGELVLDVQSVDVAGDIRGNISFKLAEGLVIGGDLVVDGSIAAKNVDVTGNIQGTIDFDLTDDLLVGGDLLIDGNVTAQNVDVTGDAKGNINLELTDDLLVGGNLLINGTVKSLGDVIIGTGDKGSVTGGDVDGALILHTTGDMTVKNDLKGYELIEVKNLFVWGNLSAESGTIIADEKIIVDGDVNGNLNLKADEIEIGGDLSGDAGLDADTVTVNHDVLDGAHFRPNLPTGVDGFHKNPDGGPTFKVVNLNVNGTYYFDDNSYLQLVKNTDSDEPLLTVGKFDASGMTKAPNVSEDLMDDAPNLEILIDGLAAANRIKLIESTSGDIDMGMLEFAGVWFYSPDHTERVFQESRLYLDDCAGAGGSLKNCIYTQLAMMQRIEPLTRSAHGASGNDVSMAAAIDDLISARLQAAGKTENFDKYYTNMVRQLFDSDDVFYKMIVAGGENDDALGIMVSQSPQRALEYVRGFGLNDMVGVSQHLALSGRISRNAVSDHLLDDFVWRRYFDKSVGWLRIGIGNEISSFNLGADTKVKRNIFGATIGYNAFDFDSFTGHTLNFGLYGTHKLSNLARAYAQADIAMHWAEFSANNEIMGILNSEFSTVDTVLDIGVLHKIFDAYVSGRGYLTMGMLGGYTITQTSGGRDFMDVKQNGKFIVAPGYELSLGKDIYFSIGSFMRPYLKAGIEYDILGGGARELEFKFVGANTYRNWAAGKNDALWLRYGAGLDFSFIVGTNLSIGYEIIKNGDLANHQIKINGAYRF